MGTTLRLAILSTWCGLAIQGQQHGSDMRMGASLAAGPAWSELNSSMEKMHVAMTSIRPTGKSDADFVRLMLPHHQAAIDMAKTQLLFGKDPQMRRLAQEIVTDQQSEIQLMQAWLKQQEQ
jgi:uncharacterized protein (DUF305 family)